MRTCGPRLVYETTVDVADACVDLWINTGNLAEPRYCRACGGWHLWTTSKRWR